MFSQVSQSLIQAVQSEKNLSSAERSLIHRKILQISRIWGVIAIFVAILVIGAIILLFGAVLVISFLGRDISLFQDVVLPVIIPSIVTLVVVCLPLVIFILKKQKEKLRLSQQIAKSEYVILRDFYDKNPIAKPDKKLLANFIESQVFVGSYNKFYYLETLEYLKKEFPHKKKRNEHDNNLLEGIARVSENLKLSRIGREKRDREEIEKEKT